MGKECGGEDKDTLYTGYQKIAGRGKFVIALVCSAIAARQQTWSCLHCVDGTTGTGRVPPVNQLRRHLGNLGRTVVESESSTCS